MEFYIVVAEWNYPTESGRDVCEITFDNKEDALGNALNVCKAEKPNFENVVGDALNPEMYIKNDNEVGYILTSKMGLDKYYFTARVFKHSPFSKTF